MLPKRNGKKVKNTEKLLLSRKDIRQDYGVTQAQANKTFEFADEIDSHLKYRIDERKVYRSTVEMVLGIKKESAGTDSERKC